jgi:hypothetical protein
MHARLFGITKWRTATYNVPLNVQALMSKAVPLIKFKYRDPDKGWIFGDLVALPGGLGLRTGAGEGVEVRVLEVDERLRSCLPAQDGSAISHSIWRSRNQ